MEARIVAPGLNHHTLRHDAVPGHRRSFWIQWVRSELVLSVLSCLLFGTLSAQTTIQYSIDLASTVNEIRTVPVESDKAFVVKIGSKIPAKDYHVTIQKRNIPIDVLTLPTKGEKIERPDVSRGNCGGFIDKVNAIFDVEKEEDIPLKYKQIQEEIGRIRNDLKDADTTTDGCTKQHLDEAENILRLTSEGLDPFTLSRGEELVVKISRESKDRERKWFTVYTAQPRGEWQISYGFSFITEAFCKQELYYSERRDTGYIILKESNRKCISFAPSIMFNWMSASQQLCDWSWSFSGGIGFDLANPTVLVGLAVAYNQNLRIHIGVAVHKQKQLLGKYSNNQVVTEALTADQLHTEQFQVNPFFSISFRFAESPFAQAVQK